MQKHTLAHAYQIDSFLAVILAVIDPFDRQRIAERLDRGLSLTSPYANHLIRAGAAVAGYGDPKAADFPVKLAPGYIGVD